MKDETGVFTERSVAERPERRRRTRLSGGALWVLPERGVGDRRVRDAMAAVPRAAFVDPDLASRAAEDGPLPIGEGQTVSQPLVVALMAQALELAPDDRVLEVGAGSGYAAAVLARLAARVDAVEVREALARRAAENLARGGGRQRRRAPRRRHRGLAGRGALRRDRGRGGRRGRCRRRWSTSSRPGGAW